MASKLGVKGSYLSRLEYGSIQPTYTLIEAAKAAYGVDLVPYLVEQGGRLVLDLAKLSETSRAMALALHAEQWGAPPPPAPPAKEAAWGSSTTTVVPRPPTAPAPPRIPEDDDSVGFLDPSELDGLDDLE